MKTYQKPTLNKIEIDNNISLIMCSNNHHHHGHGHEHLNEMYNDEQPYE